MTKVGHAPDCKCDEVENSVRLVQAYPKAGLVFLTLNALDNESLAAFGALWANFANGYARRVAVGGEKFPESWKIGERPPTATATATATATNDIEPLDKPFVQSEV